MDLRLGRVFPRRGGTTTSVRWSFTYPGRGAHFGDICGRGGERLPPPKVARRPGCGGGLATIRHLVPPENPAIFGRRWSAYGAHCDHLYVPTAGDQGAGPAGAGRTRRVGAVGRAFARCRFNGAGSLRWLIRLDAGLHYMILRAIGNGVSEQRIAKALNVNVSQIRKTGFVRRRWSCSAKWWEE